MNLKQKLLDQLYQPYKKCTMCPLAKLGRKQVVFGDGNPDASIMFIGEGPGKEEDEQGISFIGKSGKLLLSIFNKLKINRSDVFITNTVKCRPPKNRKPSKKEAYTCKNLFLFKQIQIIKPNIICTLGSTATQEILNKKITISSIRGKKIPLESFYVFPTFHPAYVLRNKKFLEIFTNDIKAAFEIGNKTK